MVGNVYPTEQADQHSRRLSYMSNTSLEHLWQLRLHEHKRSSIRPGYAVAERFSSTGERPTERRFDPGAAAGRVERLSRRILGQHPEVEAPVGRMASDEFAGCFGQQLPADAMPLVSVGHVQVVEERAPVLVLVKNHVNKTHDCCALVGDDSEVVRARGHQSRVPHLQTIGEHISIQERIKVGSSIVPSPALGMQFRDSPGVMHGRLPEDNLRVHWVVFRFVLGHRLFLLPARASSGAGIGVNMFQLRGSGKADVSPSLSMLPKNEQEALRVGNRQHRRYTAILLDTCLLLQEPIRERQNQPFSIVTITGWSYQNRLRKLYERVEQLGECMESPSVSLKGRKLDKSG